MLSCASFHRRLSLVMKRHCRHTNNLYYHKTKRSVVLFKSAPSYVAPEKKKTFHFVKSRVTSPMPHSTVPESGKGVGEQQATPTYLDVKEVTSDNRANSERSTKPRG